MARRLSPTQPPPYPSKLRTTNTLPFLTLQHTPAVTQVTNHSLHSASIAANTPIPLRAKYFFFELTTNNLGSGSPTHSLTLGLIPEYQFQTETTLGKKYGYALRSDGKLLSPLNPSGVEWSLCSPWGTTVGDTVGCGLLVESGEIFFTKGDRYCGVAFTLPREVLQRVLSSKAVKAIHQNHAFSREDGVMSSHQLMPCVTIGANRTAEINFGIETPFVFDITTFLKTKQQEEKNAIMKISVSDTLVQRMVSNYLQVNGYAKSFAAFERAHTSSSAPPASSACNGHNDLNDNDNDKKPASSSTTAKISHHQPHISTPDKVTDESRIQCPKCAFISFHDTKSCSFIAEVCVCCLASSSSISQSRSKKSDSASSSEKCSTTGQRKSRCFRNAEMQQKHHDAKGENKLKKVSSQGTPATFRELLIRRRSAEIARCHPQHDQSLFLQSVSGYSVPGRVANTCDIDSDVNGDEMGQEVKGGNDDSESKYRDICNGRGLTLEDTRRLRRALLEEEEKALRRQDEEKDHGQESQKDRPVESLVETFLFSSPQVEVDLASLLRSPSSSNMDGLTTRKHIQSTLRFRSQLRTMLNEGKTRDVVNQLMKWECEVNIEERTEEDTIGINAKDRGTKLMGLRSTPTWIYLQVLFFVQSLYQEYISGIECENTTLELKCEKQTTDSGTKQEGKHEIKTGATPSPELQKTKAAIDLALKIGREELYFLIDPQNTSTQIHATGSRKRRHVHHEIGAGEFRDVRSDKWHVWHFFAQDENSGGGRDATESCGRKKRTRDEKGKVDDLDHVDQDRPPHRHHPHAAKSDICAISQQLERIFLCTSFEFEVLNRLVSDAVKLLAIPPETFRRLALDDNFQHVGGPNNVNCNADRNGTPMEMSPKKEHGLDSSMRSSLIETLSADFFLSKQFVNIVADSVNMFVLSRCEHAPSTSTIPCDPLLPTTSYHTALDLCLTHLRTLRETSRHNKPDLQSTQKSANGYVCNYSSNPVVWVNCHPIASSGSL